MDTDTVFLKSRIAAATRLRDEFNSLLVFSRLGARDTMDVKAKKTHNGYNMRIESLINSVENEISIMTSEMNFIKADRSLDSLPADLDYEAIARGEQLVGEPPKAEKQEATVDPRTKPKTKLLTETELTAESPVTRRNSLKPPGKKLDLPKHGTTGGYSKGCRCGECRGAKRDHGRAYRERRKLRSLSLSDDQ